MRAALAGYAFNKIEEVLKEAKKSAEAVHNHPEGIKRDKKYFMQKTTLCFSQKLQV